MRLEERKPRRRPLPATGHLLRRFPGEEEARRWWEERLWPDGPVCPRCGSGDVSQQTTHRTMTHRCRSCPRRRQFSLRSGALLRSSKLSWRVLAVAACLLMRHPRIGHRRLANDLALTRPTARLLERRLRTETGPGGLLGPSFLRPARSRTGPWPALASRPQ